MRTRKNHKIYSPNPQSETGFFTNPTTASGMFRSRRFTIQQQPEPESQPESLQTKLIRAAKYGHSINKVKFNYGSQPSSRSTVNLSPLTQYPIQRATGQEENSQSENDLTQLANDIMTEAEQTLEKRDTRITDWQQKKEENKIVHDTDQQLRTMIVAYRISNHDKVKNLSDDEKKSLVKQLEAKLDRQLIQSWSDNPEQDIKNLSYAWEVFQNGIKESGNSPEKLSSYLYKCLNHDKGYAQISLATESFAEMEEPIDDFNSALESALGGSAGNTNIWGDGMTGSGSTLEEQLKTGYQEADKKDDKEKKKKEESMWDAVIQKIVKAHNPNEDDWGYVNTIHENRQQLFERVRALVPESLELNPQCLQERVNEIKQWL